MRRLAAVFLFVVGALAWQLPPVNDGAAHGDAPYLLEPGWLPLSEGKSLNGWRYEHAEKGKWSTTAGVLWDSTGQPKQLVPLPAAGDRLVNGPKGVVSNLMTDRTFGDMELYVEFLIPAKSNSGVYLHGLYKVQVYDSFGVEHPKYLDCGAIYERWIDNKGVGGTPPSVNASRRPGEWQYFQIWFQPPRFDANGRKTANAKFVRVLHNGVIVRQSVEADGPTRSGLEISEAATNPLML